MAKVVGEKCPFCNMEAVFPDPRFDLRTCFCCGRVFPMENETKEPEVRRRGLFSRK